MGRVPLSSYAKDKFVAPEMSKLTAATIRDMVPSGRTAGTLARQLHPEHGPAPEPAQPLVIPPPPWSQHYQGEDEEEDA
jgi:hypothetical protein